MIDSMEDRIHKAGKHEQFSAAVNRFLAIPKRTRESTSIHEHILYDEITNCGATPEEADEYVNLLLEGGD